MSRNRFRVGKMRKRTYTALEETGWDMQNVHKNTKTNVTPLSKLDSNIGNARPDALSDLKKTSQITDSEEGKQLEEDTIPLTTIHNLVGTCEIFSSVQPIDLDYVYK